jgi:hypothetical protein
MIAAVSPAKDAAALSAARMYPVRREGPFSAFFTGDTLTVRHKAPPRMVSEFAARA